MSRSPNSRRVCPRFEQLENRTVLSTFSIISPLLGETIADEVMQDEPIIQETRLETLVDSAIAPAVSQVENPLIADLPPVNIAEIVEIPQLDHPTADAPVALVEPLSVLPLPALVESAAAGGLQVVAVVSPPANAGGSPIEIPQLNDALDATLNTINQVTQIAETPSIIALSQVDDSAGVEIPLVNQPVVSAEILPIPVAMVHNTTDLVDQSIIGATIDQTISERPVVVKPILPTSNGGNQNIIKSARWRNDSLPRLNFVHTPAWARSNNASSVASSRMLQTLHHKHDAPEIASDIPASTSPAYNRPVFRVEATPWELQMRINHSTTASVPRNVRIVRNTESTKTPRPQPQIDFASADDDDESSRRIDDRTDRWMQYYRSFDLADYPTAEVDDPLYVVGAYGEKGNSAPDVGAMRGESKSIPVVVIPISAEYPLAADVSDSTTLAQHSADGLTTTPTAAALLEAALLDFLAEIDDIGREITKSLADNGWVAWAVGVGVGLVSIDLARRKYRRFRSQVQGIHGDLDPVSWFPGLPGPFSTQVT